MASFLPQKIQMLNPHSQTSGLSTFYTQIARTLIELSYQMQLKKLQWQWQSQACAVRLSDSQCSQKLQILMRLHFTPDADAILFSQGSLTCILDHSHSHNDTIKTQFILIFDTLIANLTQTSALYLFLVKVSDSSFKTLSKTVKMSKSIFWSSLSSFFSSGVNVFFSKIIWFANLTRSSLTTLLFVK
jgi:hypothetical protein